MSMDQIDAELKQLGLPKDALQQQRDDDILSVEGFLKSHGIVGNCFTMHWNALKNFVRVEEHHTLTQFLRHEAISRKVYILLEGSVSAYVLTDKTPKPLTIYLFEEGRILTEVSALLGGRRHYGFIANTDTRLVSLDMEYIEDELEDNAAFDDLIEVLHAESGKLTAEICNIALIRKFDLKDMLCKYHLFSRIENMDENELNSLADKMRYVYIESGQILADELNDHKIFLIESGTVTQTKTYRDVAQPEKTITITDDLYRYDVVGEDNLDAINNTKVQAVTKTPCCLLELSVNHLAPKHSLLTQVFGFFNNRINQMQHSFKNKHAIEIDTKNKYQGLAHFAFMFMIIISVASILSRFHIYFTWTPEIVLLHHTVFTLVLCLCLLPLIKPLNFSLQTIGLTSLNLRRGLIQAAVGVVMLSVFAFLLRDTYIKMYADQTGMQMFYSAPSVSQNLTWVGYSLFLMLYAIYIFVYELCARGILQNIFAMMFSGTAWYYWGSIFAAAVVASQLHLSLFNEFSIILLLNNVFAGIIFANTKNLWAVFAYHTVSGIILLNSIPSI